jgi:rhodanese-related sulfurtransferase
MASPNAPTAQSLRIKPEDLKAPLDAEESVTILDVRAAKAWESSDERIPGAIRVDPEHLPTPPPWPKDRLTVTYCT